MGIFFGFLKLQIFFGVLEIPDIFFGWKVDAGSEAYVWRKNESTPLGFDLLAPPQGPRSQGQKKKVPMHDPFMWATHTPNLVGFRPMVKEEIAWRLEAIAISPSLFLNGGDN